MAKFRKRPAVIEAWLAKKLIADAFNNPLALPKCIQAAADSHILYFENTHIQLHTKHGETRVEPDDYVVQGIKGELYPCEPIVFQESYELAECTTDWEPPEKETCNRCKGKGFIEVVQGKLL